jgi:hypothetical protein
MWKGKVCEEFHGLRLRWHGGHLKEHLLDTYLVDVLKGGSKLRIIARLRDRSISLKVEHHATLAKVSIHSVSLQELQDTSFLVFMRVDESNAKSKTKGFKFLSTCISNIINKCVSTLSRK